MQLGCEGLDLRYEGKFLRDNWSCWDLWSSYGKEEEGEGGKLEGGKAMGEAGERGMSMRLLIGQER
jgi:hypothetical protein